MKHAHSLTALVVLLFSQAGLEAQVLFSPAPGVGFDYRGRRLGVSGFFSPYFGYYPGYATTSVTYIYTPPQSVVLPAAAAPPVVINNQPIIIVGAKADVEDDGEFIRVMPKKRKANDQAAVREEALPGEAAGKFRPVDPKEREQARQPAAAEPKPIPNVKAPPPPPVQPAVPLRPADNPRDESARQVALGKEAFAAQEIGRAERRFARAALLAPNDPQPYFLMAQAQFALGKYQEAVDSIQAGLRLSRDWPNTLFRPRDLCGPNAADFDDHLQRLEETLARNPNDPALLFLDAYERWFSGQLDEARALFQRAAKVTPDKTFIELFLRARVGIPVANR